MESAVLGSPGGGGRFRAHLKNAASALWTRTLPKQRRSEGASAGPARHHTYPRVQGKRAPLACRLQRVACEPPQQPPPPAPAAPEPLTAVHYDIIDVDMSTKPNGVVKLKGTLAREVASAWGSRVGRPDQPAPADRVQSLFNDIELYPTKTQVFEMLVCARQCTRRKSLTLTFGEFSVFAAELRRCSRQARQAPPKPESPQWSTDKEAACKHVNGSEASPAPCEVFLGGSCNPTTWRSDIAIPMLKQMGITYFNPQVDDWSKELMEVEHRAKAEARALLFVLDSETRAVAAAVEAAHLAAAPRDLLLVLRPYSRHQTIARETISDQEYVELSRARATLQEAVERRGLPAFTDIPAALRCARAVLRGARTHPRQSLGHTILRLKRAFDAAGGRAGRLPRAAAAAALRDVTRATHDRAERCLASHDQVDFETFCAAVAELAADPVNGHEAEAAAAADTTTREPAAHNERLRACGKKLGLLIPKNGGNRTESTEGPGSGDSVFTPGTERRLQRLPAMLGAPTHDVYLGGAFPPSQTRPEELLRREGFTYVIPRVNDYTRMFSAPARRTAPAHPESPRTDKKPRPSLDRPRPSDDKPHPSDDQPRLSDDEEVELRDKSREEVFEPSDRLSASDFYTVNEDVTPQPFKGTYDEDLLLGSRMLVFSLNGEAPHLASMVLAAHYMGLRPHATVLVVQPMDPAHSHPYSETAVKDFNRGRHYLADLAHRSGVPVFDSTEAAINCVVSRLRATAVPNSSTS
ncbi:uncharacterized protein LOC105391236 isoform X1 [Plutella xylostella]|uniref:uncharacterized protein LOC105391236 isoform X1 n=1 Tax=Plutella xylostella TaxID=51655 RepID=UPI002032FBF4|nr:uncharacterized protein LOC105391236 isoform X1 [Plutella xylostella]XP_037964260.2 uncharacterized protein LOC105391236 isoform X1 [Plutella xylostella]XP_037964262.2 uncharacterized protein LOC105391236 isoform X1 [Plutella xylostella]XP_037964263.2 uncharacterized protein LOC105391236 isoform X1 [Plutella xylostella]